MWNVHRLKTAMHVVGQGDCVVAFRDKIWLFSDPDAEQLQPLAKLFDLNFKGNDFQEFREDLSDKRPDILTGEIDGRTLVLFNANFQFGTGSHLLKKVLQTLNLGAANYPGETTEQEYPRYTVKGEIPDSLYHGTSSENALGILRFGLMSGRAKTNFPNRGLNQMPIIHEDTVFLTSHLNKAMFHAMTATEQSKYSFPVIFKFRVPDKNLLVPDYDVAGLTQEDIPIYENTWGIQGGRRTDSASIEESAMQFSKQTGLFGYQGRIPANHIEEILILDTEQHKIDLYEFDPYQWEEVTPAQLEKAIDFGAASGAFYEDDDEYCEECRYEKEFCQCNKDEEQNKELTASSLSMIRTADESSLEQGYSGRKVNTGKKGESKTETFLIHDLDRYNSDDIGINITFQETRSRYAVGIYSINYKVGVSGFQEYWHYHKTDGLKEARAAALETYDSLFKIVSNLVDDIEYNEVGMTLVKPMLIEHLYKLDPDHKESSGVAHFNWYATEHQPSGDWRENIYGTRYPKTTEFNTMADVWNYPETSRVETAGKGRNKKFKTKYASRNCRVTLIKNAGNWFNMFGLTPALVGAFLLWASQAKGMSENELVAQSQENPQALAPLVQEFKQNQNNTQQPQTEAPKAQTPQTANDNGFEGAIKTTLQFEGGYVNDPDDKGGETNKGITRQVYLDFLKRKGLSTQNVNMQKIPDEHVREIYKSLYWEPTGCNRLPGKVAQQVFDFAVNSGPNRAVRFLQAIVGAKADGSFGPKTLEAVTKYVQQHGENALAEKYVDSRRDFVQKSKKINEKFKKGLLNRIETMKGLINSSSPSSKPMPIKPNSPVFRSKNVPESMIRPFDTKQVEVFAQTKDMPLDPGAYATEPSPHRLRKHQDFDYTPMGRFKVKQKQNPAEIHSLYFGVHATQDFDLASVYANNKGTPEDPPVVIEFATTKQWVPDVDAMDHYMDYVHQTIEEMPGLREAVEKFESTGAVDWNYIDDVFSEIENNSDTPDLEYEWNDVAEVLSTEAERHSVSDLADFFKTYYKNDPTQESSDEPERYLKGFYEWYLVPLFEGGQMDARIRAWFKNQMRFMETIEEDEILAIYAITRYNPSVNREYDGPEFDDEGREYVYEEDIGGFWSPKKKLIWKSPKADQITKQKVPIYYHGTSMSRAQKALTGILDVRSAASELALRFKKHWGKMASEMKNQGFSKIAIFNVNESFLINDL